MSTTGSLDATQLGPAPGAGDASPADAPNAFVRAWRLLRRAAIAWNDDNAMRLSAAVAMYTILSLAPLLVITIKVIAMLLNDAEAREQVRRQLESLLGPQGAAAANGMVERSLEPGAGATAAITSGAVLLITASGVFNELRDALNAVWHVAPTAGAGLLRTLRDRLLSVGMVFVIGFLLLVSHVMSVTLTLLSERVAPGAGWAAVLLDGFVSTVVTAVLFGMLFRALPDARLAWSDVLFGAVVTAALFKVGQYAMALYFAFGSTASTYGAAGSFVVVLLWVYYSCWIFFYGAELIRERSLAFGREAPPAAGAVRSPLPTEQLWQCRACDRPVDRGAEGPSPREASR